jgi:arylsulfatase A-like enzyme/Tfp pilus assembly protein PilF
MFLKGFSLCPRGIDKLEKKKDNYSNDKEKNVTRKKYKKSKRSLIHLLVVLGIIFLFPASLVPFNKVKKSPGLNVLLVTIDTLRADRVGYCGYDIETPNLDSLAYGGTRFMNALCQVPLTLPSHVSIFTGTYPPYHQIKSNGPYYLADDFTTLTEVLKAHDYLTSAFVAAYVLDSEFGLGQGFDFYDDEFTTPDYLVKHEPQRLAEEVYNSVGKWLEENHEKKFFTWVHYYDPHFPYTPPSPFAEKYKTRPYEGEIAYTDIYVGKLISLLKEKEIYDQTLIVIVGDHGEDLFDHLEPTHGIFLYDTTLKVPLIFHSPQIIPGGRQINEQVRTIDIFPSILDILKINIPKYCQGVSLIPLMEGKKTKGTEESYAETYYPLLSYGWSELKSIRTSELKYIQAPEPELYDLKNDPGETKNLFGSKSKIASRLSRKLKNLEKEMASDRKPSIRELSEEEQEKLRSLGYVAGTLPADAGKKERPDPKSKISIFEGISRGKLAIIEGKEDEGEKLLKEMLKKDPENPVIYQTLGKMYQRREEWDKAIDEFKEIININPDDVDSYYELAKSYYGKGMVEEAIITSTAALDLHPTHLKSLLFLAGLYKSLQQMEESLQYLGSAVNVVPNKLEIRLEYAQSLTFNKKFDKAIQEYEYLLDKMPDNPMIYNNLGIIYYYKNDFAKAVECLSKEVELHSNPSSYLILGLSYGKLERYSEAVNYLEKYLAQSPAGDSSLRKRAEQALSFYKSKIK